MMSVFCALKQSRTENRRALFLELLQAGRAPYLLRNSS